MDEVTFELATVSLEWHLQLLTTWQDFRGHYITGRQSMVRNAINACGRIAIGI